MSRKGIRLCACLLIWLLLPLQSLALTLPCVIEHTLRTNPNVSETIHRLEAKHETVKQAQADFFPVVDARGVYGRERSLNSNTDFEWVSLWRQELGVTIRQMLFDGFATRNQEISTMSETDAAAFKVFADSEDIALAATEAYINILRDQDFIKVAELNYKNHARLAKMITRRAKATVGRLSDTYQADARLASAEATLIEIKKQYNDDKIIFEQITGLCPDCLEFPPNPTCIPGDICELVKLALGLHPSLKEAIANIEAARAQHRAAFAPNFPRVDLVIRANDNKDLEGFPGPNKEVSALLEMQWNLFRGGKDFARQRETAFNVKSAADIRDQVYRRVIERISLAWNAHVMSRERAPALASFRDNSAKTAEAFYKLFMVGRSSLFDLLGAERDRFIAAQQFIDNKYVNLLAKYQILNAMGQLNKYLNVPISAHAIPCFKTLEKAGSFYGPLEMNYPCLEGGCCQKNAKPFTQ